MRRVLCSCEADLRGGVAKRKTACKEKEPSSSHVPQDEALCLINVHNYVLRDLYFNSRVIYLIFFFKLGQKKTSKNTHTT